MATNPGITGLDLLDGAPYGAYAVNLTQTIRYWNPAAERITGHKAENAVGRPCYEVVRNCLAEGEAPICRDGCPSLQAIRKNRIPPVCEVSMLCASGQRKKVLLTPMIIPEPLAPETLLVHLFNESKDDEWVEQANKTVAQTFTAPVPLPEITERLTPRELDVLLLMASGMTPREIASELYVSYHTVRNHTSNLRRKLGANNNFGLIRKAQELGLL